jgi:hypothetical protein
MMNKWALTPVIFILLLSACAGHKKKAFKKKDYNPTVAEQAEYYRVQEQLIESDLPNCKGCIHGAAHEKTFTAPLATYEMEAAGVAELGLRNTKFDIPVVWNKQVEIGRAHV